MWKLLIRELRRPQAFCYIIWALVAEAVGRMQTRGLHPHVYRSVNLPDGERFNARAEAEYRETGA
jgi:uncharacterized phosphosugar-binding protein